MVTSDGVVSAFMEGGAMASEDPADKEINDPVLMRESLKLGPFQMEIFKGKTRAQLGESAHMMVTPMKAGESQQGGAQPLPPGLHVLHAYTRLKMSSNKVSVVV